MFMKETLLKMMLAYELIRSDVSSVNLLRTKSEVLSMFPYNTMFHFVHTCYLVTIKFKYQAVKKDSLECVIKPYLNINWYKIT